MKPINKPNNRSAAVLGRSNVPCQPNLQQIKAAFTSQFGRLRFGASLELAERSRRLVTPKSDEGGSFSEGGSPGRDELRLVKVS